jgi:hypothetical protein
MRQDLLWFLIKHPTYQGNGCWLLAVEHATIQAGGVQVEACTPMNKVAQGSMSRYGFEIKHFNYH